MIRKKKVEKLVELTELDGDFGKQLSVDIDVFLNLQEMKKISRTWEKILARFGCDTKYHVCKKQNSIQLISSRRVDEGYKQNVHKDDESSPDASVVDPEGRVGSKIENGGRTDCDVSIIPSGDHHGEIERRQHHASIEYAPLTTVLVGNGNLSLLGVSSCLHLLIDILTSDTIGHPIARADVQEDVDEQQPVVA